MKSMNISLTLVGFQFMASIACAGRPVYHEYSVAEAARRAAIIVTTEKLTAVTGTDLKVASDCPGQGHEIKIKEVWRGPKELVGQMILVRSTNHALFDSIEKSGGMLPSYAAERVKPPRPAAKPGEPQILLLQKSGNCFAFTMDGAALSWSEKSEVEKGLQAAPLKSLEVKKVEVTKVEDKMWRGAWSNACAPHDAPSWDMSFYPPAKIPVKDFCQGSAPLLSINWWGGKPSVPVNGFRLSYKMAEAKSSLQASYCSAPGKCEMVESLEIDFKEWRADFAKGHVKARFKGQTIEFDFQMRMCNDRPALCG